MLHPAVRYACGRVATLPGAVAANRIGCDHHTRFSRFENLLCLSGAFPAFKTANFRPTVP